MGIHTNAHSMGIHTSCTEQRVIRSQCLAGFLKGEDRVWGSTLMHIVWGSTLHAQSSGS